jgi:hypothetical protein
MSFRREPYATADMRHAAAIDRHDREELEREEEEILSAALRGNPEAIAAMHGLGCVCDVCNPNYHPIACPCGCEGNRLRGDQ